MKSGDQKPSAIGLPASPEADMHWDLAPETIVETSLYGNDLNAMEVFYIQIMNLRLIARETDRHVFFSVGPGNVLLIFKPETTLHGQLFPSHGTTGPGHVAFGIKAEQLDAWKIRLQTKGIAIEKEQTWPRGGHSVYFRDPAGNSIELVTPGVWGTAHGW